MLACVVASLCAWPRGVGGADILNEKRIIRCEKFRFKGELGKCKKFSFRVTFRLCVQFSARGIFCANNRLIPVLR